MKTLLILMMICLFPVFAFADPFLAATKSTDTITKVEVEKTVGGVTTIVTGIYQIRTDDPSAVNLLDLGTLAAGTYRFRARWATAASLWSDWSVPFDAVKPASPGVLSIKP